VGCGRAAIIRAYSGPFHCDERETFRSKKLKMKKTKSNSEEYNWGTKCKGWHLVNTAALSVIQELIPKQNE